MPNPFERAIQIVPSKLEPEESGVFTIKEPSFDDLPDTEIVRNYWPSYVGKGGENFVYEALLHPELVIKVDQETLADTIGHAIEMGADPGAESLRTDEIQANKLRRARETYREVKRVFGQEHVLPQKQFMMRVPVNKAMLKHIEKIAQFRKWNISVEEQRIDNAWAIVTFQKRTDVNDDLHHLSPAVGNFEKYYAEELANPLKYQQYANVTNGLSSGKSAERISRVQLELFYAKRPLTELLHRADRLPFLRASLADFQRKAVQFAKETGQIIDISGRDNIVFNADADGNWSYTLVDPIYGFDHDIIKNARDGFRNRSIGNRVSDVQGNAMIQVANFARVINGLGVTLGTGEYFDVLPPDMQDIDIAKSIMKK